MRHGSGAPSAVTRSERTCCRNCTREPAKGCQVGERAHLTYSPAMAPRQTGLLRPQDRRFAVVVDALCYANPFSPRRAELERQALGPRFVDEPDGWSLGPGHRNSNLRPLAERARGILDESRERLDPSASSEELTLYGSLLRYALYVELMDQLSTLTTESRAPGFEKRRVAVYRQLATRTKYYLASERLAQRLFGGPEHLFALMFQLRRAFENIFQTIVGRSAPAQALRAAVWESVFTYDMRRYERSLYRRMHDTNTLILGPSGTGKELVARAIGMSRYLPFDKRSLHFEEVVTDAFFALNVGALAPTLVESELFGHKRGAFTGAIVDRVGWFESCPEHGTVFLDEIAELDPALQVKLLRVLQTREFQRVGEHQLRTFPGKVVAATNQELHAKMQRNEFREDLYYRLCSDVIETPSLRAQLAAQPDDLERLVAHVARRLVADDEVDSLVEEVCSFVRKHLGTDYAWPGNVRELEQCVRNVVVRGRYAPSAATRPAFIVARADGSVESELSRSFLAAEAPFEQQLNVYVTLSYARTGNYAATGRTLGLDRRTVKARVDSQLLARLREEIRD